MTRHPKMSIHALGKSNMLHKRLPQEESFLEVTLIKRTRLTSHERGLRRNEPVSHAPPPPAAMDDGH